VQAVGQAAWARILSGYLGEESVCFGVVLSGRDMTPEADRVAFPCLVTIPFGTTVTDKSNDELVQDAMLFNKSVRKHQFNRLRDIQRWTNLDVLFDTIFAYQKTSGSRLKSGWEVLEEISSDEVII
jgi:hypothetical protein